MGEVRYYGSFVAPNIYFLGFAAGVQFGGICISVYPGASTTVTSEKVK
jgi:hypothetical protein